MLYKIKVKCEQKKQVELFYSSKVKSIYIYMFYFRFELLRSKINKLTIDKNNLYQNLISYNIYFILYFLKNSSYQHLSYQCTNI